MPLPLAIKSLLFDLDGTLCQHSPSSQEIFFKLLEEFQISVDEPARRNVRQFVHQYWANSMEAAEDMERFGVSNDDFWTRYLQRKLIRVGLEEEDAGELAAIMQPKLEERYRPITIVAEDVRPTLKTLHLQGYILGLVSNRSKPIQDEIDQLGLLPFFDFLVTAGEVNSWKPDPDIFEYALYLAEASPESAAYIGDTYYTDIIGAQAAGLFPILFDPSQTFPDAQCMVIRSLSDLTTV
jgi:putative hydrolase of the HAD superfamily